jgi:protein-arginine deiminase
MASSSPANAAYVRGMKLFRPSRKTLIIVTVVVLAVSALGVTVVVYAAGWSGDGVRIVADVDRDGVVDEPMRVGAQSDGALVLPNIGVSGARCQDTRSSASDNELEACHDAAGEVAHAPQNLAPVRILPFTQASDRASGKLLVDGAPQGRIRVFRKAGDEWTNLKPGATFTAQDLRSGVELGVDSRDIVRDKAIWDGRFTLRVDVSEGWFRSSSGSVPMAVAPLILHNHTERVTSLFAPRSGDRADHQTFVRDLGDAVAKIGGVELKTLATDDNWAQDIVEFGYVSMPGPGGTTRTIEIAARSPQPGRVGGRAVFDLRGPGFGAVQTGGKGYHQVSSFGNLETIPPYEHNGRSFPAGRIIYGDGGQGAGFDSQALTLFASQGVQDPLKLDTSWLAIAHVDEFVQFLPADNARGWTIAVADPRAAVEVLRTTQAAGHGAVRASSRPDASAVTVDQLLSDQKFLAGNAEAAEAIDRSLKILMDETGVKREEVVGVPALFHKDALGFESDGDELPGVGEPGPLPTEEDPAANTYAPDRPFDAATAMDSPIEYAQGSFGAYVPGAVNGIVVDRKHYLAPRQWGPVVDSRDVLQDAVERAYRTAGMELGHIDDYTTHHVMGGEIHCGTNAVRAVTKPWWTKD